MNKLSQYLSVFVNSFTWQTLILAIVNKCFGASEAFDTNVVLQCCVVSVVITILMLLTEILLTKILKVNLSLIACAIVDVIEVLFVVISLGGLVFNWFEFVLIDMLIVFAVVFIVFFLAFVSVLINMKADSVAINKKIQELNSDEESNNN